MSPSRVRRVRLGRPARAARERQSGFTGSADEIIAQALDATSGFTFVMCELKAYLERGQSVGLVKDNAILIEEGR